MAGIKRSRDDNSHRHPQHKKPTTPTTAAAATEDTDTTMTEQGPYISMFTAFRDELDEHHDRRERVIKCSRDITALSKKMYGRNQK